MKYAKQWLSLILGFIMTAGSGSSQTIGLKLPE